MGSMVHDIIGSSSSSFRKIIFETSVVAGNGILLSSIARHFLCQTSDLPAYIFGGIGIGFGFYISKLKEERDESNRSMDY